MGTPNAKNIRNFSGWLYVRPLNKSHFKNTGHAESVNRNLSVTRENIYGSGSGTRQKLDVNVTETGGTLSIVLRESTAFNMALANASDTDLVYTQQAASAVILTGTNAQAGDAVSLGYTGVTDVTVTNGATDLVRGTDYDLDAAAGVIEWKKPISTYDITFDAPAVVAADRQAKIALLQKPEGITCEIMVVQKQKRGSKRYKFINAIATFFPEGDMTLIKEDAAPVTITLTGELIPNPNVPEDEQYGILVEVPNA